MSNHPAIKTVVERVRTGVIGGAADTAKEVISALRALVHKSSVPDSAALFAEVEDAVVANAHP